MAPPPEGPREKYDLTMPVILGGNMLEDLQPGLFVDHIDVPITPAMFDGRESRGLFHVDMDLLVHSDVGGLVVAPPTGPVPGPAVLTVLGLGGLLLNGRRRRR